MDINNNKHGIAFFLIGGLLIFLLTAVLDAVFVITLPINEAWYEENVEIIEIIDSVDQFGEYTSEKAYITNYDNEFE